MGSGPGNVFVIRRSKNGQFYFYLRALNSEIVATSEMYTTKRAAEDGIEAVRRAAAAAGRPLDMTDEDPID